MKRLLFLLLLSVPLCAQNWRYDSFAFGARGPIPFAAVAVCTQPANTAIAPCTPLASLCSSLTDLVCTSPNPVTADFLGNYHFYAKPSQFPITIQIYGPQVASPFFIADQYGPSQLSNIYSAQQVFQGGAVVDVSGTGCAKALQLTNTDTSPVNPNKYWRINQAIGALELVNSACSSVITSIEDGGNITFPANASIGNNASGPLNIGNPNTTNLNIGGTTNTIFTGTSPVKFLQLTTVYNSVNLVGTGMVSEVATADLTSQQAAITTTSLYAVPSTCVVAGGGCQYRVNWNSKVTQAATTSSTLGALTIVYTDPDGVAQTITSGAQTSAGAIATTSTANSTTTVLLGLPLFLNCKPATSITYAFAYASSGATPMQYNLHVRVESQ